MDVVIVGGGMVGSALALERFSIALVDARAAGHELGALRAMLLASSCSR